jgi:hypothetical protein
VQIIRPTYIVLKQLQLGYEILLYCVILPTYLLFHGLFNYAVSTAHVMRAQKTSKQPISQPTPFQHEFRMLAIKPYFVRNVHKRLIYKGHLIKATE